MKTAELLPPLLDYWVGKADGKRLFRAPPFDVVGDRWQWITDDGVTLHQCPVAEWNPSTDWAQGGPIIEREGMTLCVFTRNSDGSPHTWASRNGKRQTYPLDPEMRGRTPLIAAMRAYVASKYGEEVPDEAKP